MGGPVALLLLIVSAFLVNALLRSQGANRLISGVELLLVGLGLGPMLLGVLDEDELGVVRPAMQVAACWLGLLFGLRASRFEPPRVRSGVLLALLVEAVTAVAAVGLLLHVLIPRLAVLRLPRPAGALLDPGFADLAILLSAAAVPLALGLLAAPSSSALIEWAKQALGAKGPATDSLMALTSSDGWIPLLGLAPLCAFYPAPGASALLAAAPLMSLWAQLALALVFIAVFALLCGRNPDHETAWVVLIGLVLVEAGVSGMLALPGVVIAFLSGLGISSFMRDGALVRSVVDATERPVLLLLLLMCGLQLSAEPAAWVAAILLLVLRTSVRVALGPILAPLVPGGTGVGLGLLGAGGVTLALAVQVHLLRGGRIGQVVLWSATAMMVFSDLVGPPVLRRVLRLNHELAEPPVVGLENAAKAVER